MDEAEFDGVVMTYDAQHLAATRLSGEGTAFFAQYKAADARNVAEEAGCAPLDILDFGSGIGNAVDPLRQTFPQARLTCLDVSARSLEYSRRRNGDDIAYRFYDGELVPDDIGRFDLIFTACVFHHIPASRHVDLFRQLRSLLRPGGIFILFEHNPWNPLTQWSVKACPFDENAVLIPAPTMRKRLQAAGFVECKIRYRLFFPGPLAAMRQFEKFLTSVPIGAQYSLVGK